MSAVGWMHEVLRSDLDAEVKMIVYELFPYFAACPELRRLVKNGGVNVYDFPGGLDADSSAASAG